MDYEIKKTANGYRIELPLTDGCCGHEAYRYSNLFFVRIEHGAEREPISKTVDSSNRTTSIECKFEEGDWQGTDAETREEFQLSDAQKEALTALYGAERLRDPPQLLPDETSQRGITRLLKRLGLWGG